MFFRFRTKNKKSYNDDNPPITINAHLCKYASILVWFLFSTPILSLLIGLELLLVTMAGLDVSIFWPLTIRLGISLAVISLSGVLGYGTAYILDDLRKRFPVLRNILVIVASLGLFFVISVLTSPSLTIINIFRLTLSLISVIYFHMGVRFFHKKYTDILYAKHFNASIIIHLAIIFICWIGNLPYSMTFLIVEFTITAALHVVVENQLNLDLIIERRHQSIANLPKKIRTYNLRLTLFAVSLATLIFICRSYVASFLKLSLKVILQIISSVISFFVWLTNLLMGKSAPNDPPISSNNADVGLFDNGMAEKNSDFLLWLILAAMLLALIYFMPRIWRGFCILVDKIIDAIKSVIFNRINNNDNNNITSKSTDFVDKEERLLKPKGKNAINTHRQWVKEFRFFQKLPDNNYKFKYGYSLLERWMKLHGCEIYLPDTLPVRIHKMYSLIAGDEEQLCDAIDKSTYSSTDILERDIRLMETVLHGLHKKYSLSIKK